MAWDFRARYRNGRLFRAKATTPARGQGGPPDLLQPPIQDADGPQIPLGEFRPTSGEVTGFWFIPEQMYAAQLEAIRQAQKEVCFETFDITPGRRSEMFAEALIDRAGAGVSVLFLADSFGASSMPSDYWRRLRAGGVLVCIFNRFNWRKPWAYNRRTHCKILTIDGQTAFTGGMGVSDDWDGAKASHNGAPWLDSYVRLCGPVVGVLRQIFCEHWLWAGGDAAPLAHAALLPDIPPNEFPMLVTHSYPDSGISALQDLLEATIRSARYRVWFASPYFLPTRPLRDALWEAKERGLDVRVLTVGPYHDHATIYYAVRERYALLLPAGIAIYEYLPAMMHAKVLLADDRVVLGSANCDPRSLFLNLELNITTSQPELIAGVKTFFRYGWSKSRRIEPGRWRERPLWQRLIGRLTLPLRSQL